MIDRSGVLDLREWDEAELYDQFQNDEGLYNDWMIAIVSEDLSYVDFLCTELFQHTDEQHDYFVSMFYEELEAHENL